MQGRGHLEFTGAPDPMRMAEMLSSLSPDQLEGIMKSAKDMMPSSNPTSQEGIRKHWEKLKADRAEMQKIQRRGGMHAVTTTQSWDVKKRVADTLKDSDLAPIRVADMGVGTTHRGRFLFGKVADIGGFWSIASGALLVEDLCGASMEVAVYNYPKERFAGDFPPGREICIVEPYLKLRGDGSVGIRVDDPSEIRDHPLPATADGWKALGNSCINHCPDTALACYESGLRAPNRAVLDMVEEGRATASTKRHEQEALDLMLQVSKLLTNLAICEFNLKHFHSSLLHSLLAFGLSLNTPKAAFWVAKSLQAIALDDEAHSFAAWYCRHDADNSASLRNEFRLTENDANTTKDGASWIHGSTLLAIAKASHKKKINLSESTKPWLSMKQLGNDYFKEGNTLEARSCYATALSTCPFLSAMLQDASFITSNKGAALLSISKLDIDTANGAMISMLCAALMNCYGNGRAWVRVGRFLELQGRHDDAISFLNKASVVIEDGKLKLPFGLDNLTAASGPTSLQAVKKELSEMKRRISSRSNVKSINHVSTEDQLKQRIVLDAKSGRSMDKLDEEIATSEQLVNMHKMMVMFADKEKTAEIKHMTGPTQDRDLQDYCSEFLQSVGVPDGLDKAFVRKVLFWSYMRDRTSPWWRAMGWRMAWSGKEGKKSELGELLMDDDDILKRWHGSYPLKIISENPTKYAQIGAIIDFRSMKPENSYESRIRSNFVNCPHRHEIFFEGTTHLAIGFNDLNSLVNCKWMDAVEIEYSGKAAHFVGLEMNPFNVAKTLVIAEMLARPDIPLDHILQAWYSSVWSKMTLANFRLCIQSVLEKGDRGLAPHRQKTWGELGTFSATNVSDAKVASYLHHWLSVDPISYKVARRLWLDNIMQGNVKMFGKISSCKRHQDMLAIAQYCLTGEVFGNSTFQPHGLNAAGSLTYWQCPEGSPPLGEESMFNAFALEDVMSTYHENKSKDIVQVFEARATAVLGALRSKLSNGSLTIELYIGVVKPLTQTDGHDLVNFVATRLKPYTIGWSNVIDYMELDALHDLGRAMSSHGDVAHYAYSMNWCTETFGANIFDFQMTQNYAAANYILDLALGENYGGGNPEKMNMMKALMTAVGANELFLCPDYDTPMNSTSFIASHMTKEHWVKYFYDMAGGRKEVGARFKSSPEYCYQPTNCGFNAPSGPKETSPVLPCPLHRISTQIYLGWTYDPKLKPEHKIIPPSEIEMEMISSFLGDMAV